MFQLTALLRRNNYRSVTSLKTLFDNSVPKSTLDFDHLVIDIGTLAGNVGWMTRNLLGHEKERETIGHVREAVFNLVLRRVRAKKSVAVFMDGADPLWKLRRTRRYPHKRFDGQFYRSAASPMAYALEDRLLRELADGRRTPPELVFSGPAAPGPVEAKLSAWSTDMVVRGDVDRNDSFCLVGGIDTALSALGAVPFHNLTVVRISTKTLQCVSLSELMDWLALDAQLTEASETSHLHRHDVVLLMMMGEGCSATHLNPLGVELPQLLDAYHDLCVSKGETIFKATPEGEVVVQLAKLEKVVARSVTHIGAVIDSSSSRDYLELLLQSHAMHCLGGIPNNGFATSEALIVKPPTLKPEAFAGYLRFRLRNSATVAPTKDSEFALTAAEMLLVTSPQATLITQLLPAFTGHAVPPAAAEAIVDTEDVHKALAMSRAVLSLVAPSEEAHPSLSHGPSFCYLRRPGNQGPPVGYQYASVNLGQRGEEGRAVAKSMAASENPIVVRASSSGKDTLMRFDAAGGDWAPMATRTTDTLKGATLRVASWNVQFNRHTGEPTPLGRAGIDWHSSTRYVALAAEIEALDADIVAMQEVEPAWWAYLAERPWVRANYRLTSSRDQGTITPWGNMMLVHHRVPVSGVSNPNAPAYSGHVSLLPTVAIPLTATRTLNITTLHLLAPFSEKQIELRKIQLAALFKALAAGPKGMGSHSIVLGDFNDYPSSLVELPPELGYTDAWLAVHGPNGPAGRTIDGDASTYCAKIIEPQFWGRADRVVFRSGVWKAVGARLVGTRPVAAMALDGAKGLPCPDYLFPSDHFGVCVDFAPTA